MHGAPEAPGLGQVAGGAQQHGHVAVVAAGVHAPGVHRLVIDARGLGNVQRVHIGTQPNGRPLADRERTDHAGAGQPPVHIDTELPQALGDEILGLVLLEGGLGVGMQVPPPGGHVAVQAGDSVDDGHAVLLPPRPIMAIPQPPASGRARPPHPARRRHPAVASAAMRTYIPLATEDDGSA